VTIDGKERPADLGMPERQDGRAGIEEDDTGPAEESGGQKMRHWRHVYQAAK